MTPATLTDYLCQHIPLAKAMGVAAIEAGLDGVTLRAPLGPNINVHGTFFGGSAATLCLLAGWSSLFVRLSDRTASFELVVQHTEMNYLRPVQGDAEATARVDDGLWHEFTTTLDRHGRARMAITIKMVASGETAARQMAKFAAISRASSAAGE